MKTIYLSGGLPASSELLGDPRIFPLGSERTMQKWQAGDAVEVASPIILTPAAFVAFMASVARLHWTAEKRKNYLAPWLTRADKPFYGIAMANVDPFFAIPCLKAGLEVLQYSSAPGSHVFFSTTGHDGLNRREARNPWANRTVYWVQDNNYGSDLCEKVWQVSARYLRDYGGLQDDLFLQLEFRTLWNEGDRVWQSRLETVRFSGRISQKVARQFGLLPKQKK